MGGVGVRRSRGGRSMWGGRRVGRCNDGEEVV